MKKQAKKKHIEESTVDLDVFIPLLDNYEKSLIKYQQLLSLGNRDGLLYCRYLLARTRICEYVFELRKQLADFKLAKFKNLK